MSTNRVDPDQTPHNVVSDQVCTVCLGLSVSILRFNTVDSLSVLK